MTPPFLHYENITSTFDDLPLDKYESYLSDISKNSLGVPIKNKDKNHASVLMKYLFDETLVSLNFYVNNFSGTFSSDTGYLESLRNCLYRSVEVNVLLDNAPNDNSEAYSMIESHIRSTRKGSIGIATEESKSIIGKLFIESKPLHFAVSDEKRYRIETHPVDKTAYANFNDIGLASKLTNTIHEAIKKSTFVLKQ